MNGFELHLDDDINFVAAESFWAFISGGSPILSAFEWILMMHHLDITGSDENMHFDAWAVCDRGAVADDRLDISNSEDEKASVDCSSSAVGLVDSNSSAVFKSDVVARLECDNYAGSTAVECEVVTDSPAAEGASCDADALSCASSMHPASAHAAPSCSAVVRGGWNGLDAELRAQLNSLDSHSGAEFVENSPIPFGKESLQGVAHAAAAAIFEDQLAAANDTGRVNVDVTQSEEVAVLAMEDPVRPDLCGYGHGNCIDGAELVPTASAPSHSLLTGHVALSESCSEILFEPSASHTLDPPSLLNPAALCTLAQVTHTRCAFHSLNRKRIP